jgi:hypothetical protein
MKCTFVECTFVIVVYILCVPIVDSETAEKNAGSVDERKEAESHPQAPTVCHP